jgi:xylan 1,4-beta-xylosidase
MSAPDQQPPINTAPRRAYTTQMNQPKIQNPILPGFNPDPSILRVEDDFYLVTSTFEWFPGCPIYHSRDLIHWRPIGHILTRTSQLNMLGVPDSGGVWAPALSYHKGTFYLAYTIVHTKAGPFKDIHNFLITAPDILGPWSDPIYLNASGFDPSLFHDDDGRKWVTNVLWDHRKGNFRFAGIVLQEFSPEQRKLIGPITNLVRKSEVVEGPNIYKINGLYYLTTAEGGTGLGHRVTVYRSRQVQGPYEADPQLAVLTASGKPHLRLQKAGHCELVQTRQGEWYMPHLAARPLPNGRCPLGRETSIQKVFFNADGWLRMESGSTDPQNEVTPPKGIEPHPWPARPTRDDFDEPTLKVEWCSLRVPVSESWASLSARPGWLRLFGRESVMTRFEQSLLAQRQQSFQYTATTRVQFEPTHYSQMAGLVCWYDSDTHYYLRITHDEQLGKILQIALSDNCVYDEIADSKISIADWKDIYLQAVVDHDRLQFSASKDGTTWQPIGPVLDASKIGDDYAPGLRFTGAFVGICCQDVGGTRQYADFDFFDLVQKL